MLGSGFEAKVALQRDHNFNHGINKTTATGWRRLGGGCTRTAYLSPSRVVYKVGDDYTNANEARVARRLRGNKKMRDLNVKIPQTRLWRVQGRTVMAMEYVPSYKKADCASLVDKPCNCRPTKTRLCWTDFYDRLSSEIGLCDMWHSNVRYTRDGSIYIIDLGEEE